MKNISGYRKIAAIVITAQCSGQISKLIFENGFLLNFLSRLGMESSRIILVLSFPMLFIALFSLPAAFVSDWKGKKLVGITGLAATVAGLIIVDLAGFFDLSRCVWLVILGLVIYSTGLTLFGSSWFALLNPLIPPGTRGRFFGRLRMSWQAAALLFTWIIFFFIDRNDSIAVYRIILAAVTIFTAVRLVIYKWIPEVEKTSPVRVNFRSSISSVLKIPGYLPFNAYVFLLMLFIGACPSIFNLMEKDIIGFSEGQIVLMGNLLFAGSIAGYAAGGKMVDRLGTKPVFLICHFGFAAVLFLFLLRNMAPIPVLYYIGSLTFMFGIIRAASTIAITTELMALLPVENKSLAAAFNVSMLGAGTALSAFFAGKALDIGLYSSNWILMGQGMSSYDAMLLIDAVMVILLVITLGLIPSVIGKSSSMPYGG